MSETRKLAAILVADVVGYSRLAGTDEDRTLARLRGLRSDLIKPAIAAHHGDRPIRAYSLDVGVPAKAKPAEPVTPAAPTPQRRRSGLAPLAAALAALLIAIAGGAWWVLNANRPGSVATKAPAEAARLSIVVLPFANLSGDPKQDYFVDALTDELTTALSRMRDTFVIARNTALTFKGKSSLHRLT